MSYKFSDLIEILSAEALAPPNPEALVKHIFFDSRRIAFPADGVFFALNGQRFDGHDFIEEVYRAGGRCFVIAKNIDIRPYPDANFLKVSDSLRALQNLAAFHREQFDLPVVGITGSNGKTIVKEWLFQLLQPDFSIVRSPRSYNSQLGVPLSVWALKPTHQLAIFEAGVSRVGEMQYLAPIIKCEIGLITNIGAAHSEGFSSLQEKAREKLKLFSFASTIVYCRDYPEIEVEIKRLGKACFSWSRERSADLQIVSQWTSNDQSTRIVARLKEREIEICIPFSDEASIENAIHCWAVLLQLGYENDLIARRMLQLETVAMRLELKEGVNQCVVINDSYNSDFNSLNIALHFLARQKAFSRRTLILSDILQSGLSPEELYREVAPQILNNGVGRVIGIGRQVSALGAYLPADLESHFFADTESFLKNFERISFEKEAILLKGARRFAFEQIAQLLAKKTHRTVLEVDLNALTHNLRIFQSKLKPKVRLMAMVKAAAYGSGSLEVAKLLAYQGADYLAVAYADEGVELRLGGVHLPIMVLNPEVSAFELLIRHKLEPEIYNFQLLFDWINLVQERDNSPAIHLKLDTGMHRLGFGAKDLNLLCSYLQNWPFLKVQSVFTHLAASEAKEHDAFTLGQIEEFSAAYEQIANSLGYRPLRHVLNSSGIIRFPEHQFEMVRLGIGLYGVDAGGDISDLLRRVLSLKASISQIKNLEAGETVGYGRGGKVKRSMRLATISIGYADGLPRSAGNGRYSLKIRGRLAPTVGSICMDMCMLDISHIPEAREGDLVEVFGDQPSVTDLAACDHTIPYEVFTRISPRVKRVYIQD